MGSLCRALTALALAAIGAAHSGGAQAELRKDPLSVLANVGSLTHDELTAVEKGEVFVKALKTKEKKEISVFGVVRLERTVRPSLAEFRDSLSQKNNNAVLAGGPFSVPPSRSDLQKLRLEKDDLDDLGKCRPGNCDLLVSDAFIQALATIHDGGLDHRAIEELFTADLVQFAFDFERRGLDTLKVFDGLKRSPSLADQNMALVDRVPFLSTFEPSLAAYLKDFPTAQPSATEVSLNWTKVNFGLKPIVTITQAVSHAPADEKAPLTIVTRQIYASRYMNASVAVSMLVRDGERGPIYLIFANISRSDALGGLFSGIKKGVATSEGVDRTRDLLQTVKARLEHPANGAQTATAATDGNDGEDASRGRGWIAVIALIAAGAMIVIFVVKLRSRSRQSRTSR